MKTRPFILTAVLAAVLVVTGCSSQDPKPEAHQVAESFHAETVEEIAASQSSEPEPTEGADGLSPRGFIPKELGEAGGLLDGDEPVVEFALTEIRWDYQCGEYAMSSENGSFVGLNFDVEVFPAWADQDWALGSFMMTEFDFQAFDGDGSRVNDVGGTAYACADSSDVLPSDIGAGQSASGWIILDLPEDAAIVAYVLPFEGIGVEWQLH